MCRAARVLAICLLGQVPAIVAGQAKSILGSDLETCSKPGTALTGFTRDGHCQDLGDDDGGSHHICIQMKDDFCEQTGQPNWCAEKMPCMGNEAEQCYIGNWCVCQWAFARYIQMAGGCDAIVDLQCDATNMAAVKAYEKEASSDPGIKDALDCIKQKCPQAVFSADTDAMSRLNDNSIPGISSSTAGMTKAALGPMAIPCLLLALVGLAFVAVRRSRSLPESLE